MNKFPTWKNVLLIVIAIIGLIYAVPNLFVDDPSVQVASTTAGAALTQTDLQAIENDLKQNNLRYKSADLDDGKALVRFTNIDTQSHAKDVLTKDLGEQYIVALTLASTTPGWLKALGASPMRLGLDLRGGVSLTLQVDTDDVIEQRLKGNLHSIADTLREQHLRYTDLALDKQTINITFNHANDAAQAKDLLSSDLSTFLWNRNGLILSGNLTKQAITQIHQYTIEQTRETLQRRVDALGVSYATVQQAGLNRINVDLPGVQDPTMAQNILGKTATVEFHMVDVTHDPMVAASNGIAPPGTALYTYQGQPILLKDEIVLSGNSITSATSGFDQNGQPSVNIKIGGAGESQFYHITSQNINKPLAVLYVETKSHISTVNGKKIITYTKNKKVINSANIESALGANFQIMGMQSVDATKQLALLLRSGALVAPVTIVAEQTIGPSMGKQNVHQGMLSLEVGLVLVIIFMALYYSFFGVIADIGLLLNLVLLVAVLSLIGNVLTFPGIAGIVLTLGMAIDANVLIFERIREEIRNGVTVQAAIHSGYEKAFATIIDSNLTTFIAAIVLFSIGTGAIKGFAITLSIGLVTSVFTAVTYTRALVNAIYGGRRLTRLPIGIKNRIQVEEK